MRRSLVACLFTALLWSAPGKAQPRLPIQIETVQVGFGSSALVAEYKSGFWAPVYIDVMAGPQGTPRGEIVVQSIDSDDVPNRYTVPLPQLGPGEQESILSLWGTDNGQAHSWECVQDVEQGAADEFERTLVVARGGCPLRFTIEAPDLLVGK